MVPLAQISDRASFHDVFARIMGFPQYYGRNMDAWIDLMSSLACDRAAALKLGKKDTLTLALQGAETFRAEHPDLWDDLIDCASTVNFRRIKRGEPSMLALAYE